MRIKIDDVRAFNKISKPTNSDSLQYIKNLANISYNYCDSSTISYHKEIVERIFEMYPFIKERMTVLTEIDDKLFINDTYQELLVGLTNILSENIDNEEFKFDGLNKINETVFYLIYQLYPYLDQEEKEIYLPMVEISYIENDNKEKIKNNWIYYIEKISSEFEYLEHASLFSNLIYFFSQNGEQELSLLLAENLHQKCMQYFDYNSKDNIICLSNLGLIYFNTNDYENALNNLKTRLEIYHTLNIPDKEIQHIFRDICHCLFSMSLYKEAITYAQKVVSLYDTTNSIEYCNDFKKLLYLKFYLGFEEEALSQLNEIISLEREYFPQLLTQSYNNISNFYRINGDMVNSLKFANLSVLEWENNPSEDYEDLKSVFHSLVNMGAAYLNLNDIQSSMSVIKRTSEIYLKLKEIQRFDRTRTEIQIMALSVLARDYLLCNHLEDAEVFLNKALELSKDHYGENNVKYLYVVSILADLKALKGDFKGAKTIYEDIIKRVDPNSHAYYGFLSSYSDYCMALENYEEAYKIISQAYSKTNSIEDLIRLSRIEFQLDKQAEFQHHIKLIFEKNSKRVNRSFLSYNDIQRRSFWSDPYVGYWFTEELPGLIIKSKIESEELKRVLYDATIFSKGIILSTNSDISRLIKNSNDSKLISKYNEFNYLNKKFDDKENNFQEASFFNDRSRLESEIMTYVEKNGFSISAFSIDSKEIQRRLNDNSLAIEFLAIQLDSTEIKNYYALVLDSSIDNSPRLISLFDSNSFNLIPKNNYYKGTELSNLIWKPLLQYIKNKKNIYFSPAGILNNIAIEYLPYLKGEGCMNDNFNLIRLSNTREIVTNSQRKSHISHVCCYGGIYYDADINVLASSEDNCYPENQSRALFLDEKRGSLSYLPETKIEIERIDSIIKNHNIISKIYTGFDATEASFKKLGNSISPTILHVASHGIYYTEEDLKNNEIIKNLSFINKSEHQNIYTEDYSMTHTALLFSGSNRILKGESIPNGYEDGVLTAQEISFLNLDNTDLVVLSACQTGLGDLKGDGVFGLQRGFKKAGVNSILMSLWDVDDEATQLLMTSFYQNYLKGLTKQEALHEAQKVVRETPGFEDPEYWAAFILLDALN